MTGQPLKAAVERVSGPEFKDLSLDAKIVVAGYFSFGTATRLTFQTPWNVTARMKAALDEAVSRGVLTLSVGEEGLYAHTYRLAKECRPARSWAAKNMSKAEGFSVMVADAERQERPPAIWPVPAGFKRHPK